MSGVMLATLSMLFGAAVSALLGVSLGALVVARAQAKVARAWNAAADQADRTASELRLLLDQTP